MINKNYFKDLLVVPEYVREPVDNICRKIEEETSKKIILCGERGSGKTNILYHLETKGVGNKDQYIYMRFDTLSSFSHIPDVQKFLIHYYELLFSKNLLHYIKKYYSFTYQKYFLDFEPLLNSSLDETHHYINNYYFEDVTFSNYFSMGQVSTKILTLFKKCLHVESFALVIDRFDWLISEENLQQSVLHMYFDLFDKVVITSDDKTLMNSDHKNALIENGYSFVEVDYSKDCDVVTEIIRRKIQQYNEESIPAYRVAFDVNQEFVQRLIDRTNGNISLMMTIIMGIRDIQNWEQESFSFSRAFDSVIEEKIHTQKELKKISTPPKFYL